jgi:hypothetical protein
LEDEMEMWSGTQLHLYGPLLCLCLIVLVLALRRRRQRYREIATNVSLTAGLEAPELLRQEWVDVTDLYTRSKDRKLESRRMESGRVESGRVENGRAESGRVETESKGRKRNQRQWMAALAVPVL